MKQARATDKEVENLAQWFYQLEEKLNSYPTPEGIGNFVIDNLPEWRRTVFGYQVLVDNCADKTKDYLDWKPEIKEKMGY
jgi:hypothetical protein